MSAVHKVMCPACKGRGWYWAYVNEWTETKERFVDAYRRIWKALTRRKS